ncbi:MAG: Tm-1-like ATP-binding domain-containing protein [Thermodesulfobacteriota bacterium]
MTGLKKSVLVVSTLDTKGEETDYLKKELLALGVSPVIMDISMGGRGAFQADIPAEMVAEAGGSSFDEIRSSRERSKITRIITKGGIEIAGRSVKNGAVSGIIGIGGSTGTLMATDIMRSLPFGFPKLMISSTAALPGLATRYIGTGDILLFHTVVEIAGITGILKNVLDRAVFAVVGMMSDGISPAKSSEGKAIALTMLGPCEKCAVAVRKGLERCGFQVIGFSAAGIGDRAMEDMISDGFFQGVVDLAPGGVGEHLFGFMRDAGPHRMESAGKLGIPQIISLCSVNHMTPSKSRYKPDYHERRKFDLDKYRTWIRLSTGEMEQVADVFAEKLNTAKGPVTVMIPDKGWSSVDAPGNPTYDPGEDRIFVERLRRGLKSHIRVVEVDSNMEDPQFSEAIIAASTKLFT